MTDDKIALREMPQTGSDATFLRGMIGFAAQRPMEPEAGGVTGGTHGERSPDRLVQRDGRRDGDRQTRVGMVELRPPKLRRGCCLPAFLEPRRTAGEVLTAVIEEACVRGISTRSVDEPVRAMGLEGIGRRQVQPPPRRERRARA